VTSLLTWTANRFIAGTNVPFAMAEDVMLSLHCEGYGEEAIALAMCVLGLTLE
jgi:Zn ribbon nucleic-acid-binding protein